jgi:hypothetical protein
MKRATYCSQCQGVVTSQEMRQAHVFEVSSIHEIITRKIRPSGLEGGFLMLQLES